MGQIKLNNFIFYICVGFLLQGSIVSTSQNTVMLKKENKIICATEDDVSPIFLDPPIKEEAKYTRFREWDETLISAGWLMNNSRGLFEDHVFDKRWEDFETIYNDYYHAGNTNESMHISIYSPKVVEFFMDDDEVGFNREDDVQDEKSWIHYSILFKETTVYIIKNGTKIFTFSDITPTTIVVRTQNKTHMKIHKYKTLEVNKVSHTPKTLTVPEDKDLCLMMYVYLCPHCQLDVNTSTELTSFSRKHSPFSPWQSKKFLLKRGENIRLHRRTNNTSEDGIWALELKECSNSKSRIYTQTFRLEDEKLNRTCKIFQTDDSATREQNNCRDGFLGQNCSFRCEDILLDDSPNCDGYRICIDNSSNCLCPWGFNGTSCSQTCEFGYRGLSCKDKCIRTEDCGQRSKHLSRSKQNGSSSSHRYEIFTSIWFLVLSQMFIIIFTNFSLIYPSAVFCNLHHSANCEEKSRNGRRLNRTDDV